MSEIPKHLHPRPDRYRDAWLCLNGEWDFEIDNENIGAEREYFKRDALAGKITVPFCPESKLSGVEHKDFMKSVWYRRDISLPAEWSGKRILLHIDASDYETTVYVNSVCVGIHRGGYTPFEFDITDYLKSDGNYITVHAYDDIHSWRQAAGKQSHEQDSFGCFYTRTTGIWQTVWLEAVERAHVISYKAYPNISAPSVALDVKTKDALGATLRVKAYYGGRLVGEAQSTVVSAGTTLNISLSETHLWECGNGRLYELEFALEKDGCVDKMNGYFGLREVSVTKDRGLQINGKTVFGRFILDQGFYPDGVCTAPNDEALIFDIEAAMACGFNGARLHQKVFEPRYLYHADRLGYMVWGETGNWHLDHTLPEAIYWFLPEWLEEIERDFSHPSLIGWCPFNETWEVNGRPQCNEFLDRIYDITKALDPTRPVITASGSFPTERTDIHDVHDYEQDPEKFREYYSEIDKGVVRDQIYRQFPGLQRYDPALPVFVSEYGGIKWAIGGDAGWGYGNSVQSEEEYFSRLRGLTDVLLDNGKIFAFCLTQLTDVEQEINGLLTYDRRFKFPPERFKEFFGRRSVIED